MRERIFQEKLSFPDFASLQSYVETRVIGLAKTMEHPDFVGRSIYEVFEEEKEYLVKTPSQFDGYISRLTNVSTTCLVNYERNQYSVPCKYAGKPVEIQTYAWNIRICHNGEVICDHARNFGKKNMVINPLHYLPVLERKPGALRNGRPFLEWKLPCSIESVKDYLLCKPGGDRQVAEILNAIPRYGLEAVEVACELALEQKVICKSLILNFLSRVSEEPSPENVSYEHIFYLKNPPLANCAKYDDLMEHGHGA